MLQVRLGENTLLGERLEADQQRIAGTCRKALKGRVAIASRVQGSTCQSLFPDCFRKSMKRYASVPKSPIPGRTWHGGRVK